MNLEEEIKSKILEALPGAEITISDPMCDNAHFEAVVIAKEFEEMPLFEQHQAVMGALKETFNTKLHALGLKTYSPTQWEKKNGRDS